MKKHFPLIIRLFLLSLIVNIIGSFSIDAAETNFFIRTGFTQIDLEPKIVGIRKIRSASVDIQKTNSLSVLSFDLFYDYSKIFYLDYYKSFEYPDTKQTDKYLSFSPLSFLNNSTTHNSMYLVRFLLSTEYLMKESSYRGKLCAREPINYFPVSGNEIPLQQNQAISINPEYSYEEISFDLCGGAFKNKKIVIEKDDTQEMSLIKKIFQGSEYKVGCFKAQNTIFLKQPEYGLGLESDIIYAAEIQAEGFVYGVRSKNRAIPGVNLDFVFAYGKGDVTHYTGKKQKIIYDNSCGDIWYNWYFKVKNTKVAVTIGYRLEMIEIYEDDTNEKLISKTDFHTYYVQTGFLF